MKETKPEALFAAWLALPEDKRNAMDAEIARDSRAELREGLVRHSG